MIMSCPSQKIEAITFPAEESHFFLGGGAPIAYSIFWPQDPTDGPKSHFWSQLDAKIPQGHFHRETGDT